MNYQLLATTLITGILLSLPVIAKPSLTIVTSIQPMGLIAQAIVGDKAKVEVLLPHNASPHHYALKISDRRRLAKADLVLWVGESLESFLAKPISQRSGAVIEAMSLAGITWPKNEGRSKHVEHDGHHHGDQDPHLWLNPLNNEVIIESLVEQLRILDPDNADYYFENAKTHKAALQQLDRLITSKMTLLQDQAFIVDHPAYDHFVSRYDLNQLDFIRFTPERRAGAKHLFTLRKQKAARCVFQDYGSPTKKAAQLAKNLTIPLYTLDPLGAGGQLGEGGQYTIVELIEQLADNFHRCLRL